MISGSAFRVGANIRRLLPKVHSPSSDLYVSIMFSMSDWPDVSKTKGFFVKNLSADTSVQGEKALITVFLMLDYKQ